MKKTKQFKTASFPVLSSRREIHSAIKSEIHQTHSMRPQPFAVADPPTYRLEVIDPHLGTAGL